MNYLSLHKVNKKFIFVDECPWNLETGIYYGWNLKGKPIKIPKHPKTSHISLIAAVYDEGLLCFRCFRGILRHQDFNSFVLDILEMLMKKGYNINDFVIIWDKAKSHYLTN